ncbi:MAG TPA: biopolymer transporter ExbD [Candidatus Saccharimonadales bacterium]|nr:biopolymer transporter ExbD [Candidatus Saccharimonadales bacterium]
MKKTSQRGHSTLNELNITPLLDLVFVLLVIFIITTPQMVNSLEMALPSSKPPPQNPNTPKPKINRIIVDHKGKVFLNDALVPDRALKTTLQALKTSDPDPKIVVKGADDVDYQSMIKVLDALQQLEITKVGLATQ